MFGVSTADTKFLTDRDVFSEVLLEIGYKAKGIQNLSK